MDNTRLKSLLGLAARLIDAGRYKEAQTVFEGILTLTPCSDAWRGMGIVASRTGRHSAAVEWFLNAHQQDPEDLDTRMQLAQVMVTTGRKDEARPHLERLIDSPKHVVLAKALLAS